MSFLKRFSSSASNRESQMDPKDQAQSIFTSMSSSSATPTNPFASSPPTRRPEAPPAYTAAPPSYSTYPTPTYTSSGPLSQPMASNVQSSVQNQGSSDDKYAFLGQFDTIFLIDDSGSMAGRSWRETAAALEAITPICTKYDADGIDVHFLNAAQKSHTNIHSVATVQRIFHEQKPYGSTPTGTRLNQILRPYLRELEAKGADAVKPLNVIVITDGVATDDVETVIIQTAKKLEKLDAPGWQVGVQFFQVGNEAEAAAALRELDDDLVEAGCPRDIVDTVPFNGEGSALSAEGILKVVLGSVNRKLDRKRASAEDLRL